MDALWLQPRRMEDEMFQDLRFSLRMLLKNPGFTLGAMLSLAVGIGANSAIFSVVNAVLLRPLPYQDPDRLALINYHWSNMPDDFVRFAEYLEISERAKSFDQIAACRFDTADLTDSGDPEFVAVGAY